MKSLFLFTSLFFAICLQAQDSYSLSTVANTKQLLLDQHFKRFQLLDADPIQFKNFVDHRNQLEKFKLNIAHYGVDIVLYPYDIRSENYRAVVQTENGPKILDKEEVITYRGYVDDKQKGAVRLTINKDFIYGFMETKNGVYHFEPSRYFTADPQDKTIVFYAESDLINPGQASCGNHSYATNHNNKPDDQSIKQAAGQCFINNLAIATDYSMYIDPAHNTVDQLLNHTLGVSNNVSTNFELNGSVNFSDGLEIEVASHFISACQLCDPWSTTLDFLDLLDEFSLWAPNGFADSFDMGQLWTDRDFIGGAVGMATLATNLLCNDEAFHILQDWSTNASLLRVMTAHEMGHNLNGVHSAAPGYLLSPVVSITNNWESSSQTTIGNQITQQGNTCLLSCQPVACSSITGLSIDQISATDFTLSWDPSSSGSYKIVVVDVASGIELINMTSLNTTETLAPLDYAICKQYDVFLSNDCPSGQSGTTVLRLSSPSDQGCAYFDSPQKVGHIGLAIQFLDKSANATSWLWDFGDGTSSNLQNPTHAYTASGNYDITLTVNQGIHSSIQSDFIKILPNVPTPYTTVDGGDFESNFNHFAAYALEGDAVLFEHGIAGNALSSTSNVWKTKLDSDIGKLESDVVLLSPKFDFSSQGVYLLNFDMSMEVLFCNGPTGAKIEYSIDNGQSWIRLGSYGDSGPDIAGWYDRGPADFCPLATQVFTDQMGWGFTGYNQNKSYDVSFLAGYSGVIFRYRYSVSSIFSGGYNVDGISIDNFEITALKSALPVNLLNFEATKRQSSAILSWTSIEEVNTALYEIEKRVSKGQFVLIGEQVAQNEEENQYEFIDKDLSSGLNFYRLKIIDVDGSISYSETISLRYGDRDLKSFSIYPNPTSLNEVNLDIDNIEVSSLKLFDLNGRLLNGSRIDYNEKVIDINGLDNGIYIIQLTDTNGEIYSAKLSKI